MDFLVQLQNNTHTANYYKINIVTKSGKYYTLSIKTLQKELFCIYGTKLKDTRYVNSKSLDAYNICYKSKVIWWKSLYYVKLNNLFSVSVFFVATNR